MPTSSGQTAYNRQQNHAARNVMWEGSRPGGRKCVGVGVSCRQCWRFLTTYKFSFGSFSRATLEDCQQNNTNILVYRLQIIPFVYLQPRNAPKPLFLRENPVGAPAPTRHNHAPSHHGTKSRQRRDKFLVDSDTSKRIVAGVTQLNERARHWNLPELGRRILNL